MALGRPLSPLTLVPAELQQLLEWSRRPKTAQALALRARIVLLCAEGRSNTAVARRVQVTGATVCKWRQRFVLLRLDGLLDEPRPGTPRHLSDSAVERVLARTLESQPQAATHWSTRSLAQATGLSQSSISRIWRAFSLQPHRSRDLQAEPRSAVHRQSSRHRRPVSEPARSRPGAVRGREEPDSSPGSNRSRCLPHASRTDRTPHARLQTPRHHHACLPLSTCQRHASSGQLPSPSPLSRVPPLSRHHRAQRARRNWTCTSFWTTTVRTRRNSFAAGWLSVRASICTSLPRPPLG